MKTDNGELIDYNNKDIKCNERYTIYINNNEKERCISFFVKKDFTIVDIFYGNLTDYQYMKLIPEHEFFLFKYFIESHVFKDNSLMKKIFNNKLRIDFNELHNLEKNLLW